jgi:hypothetical protein
LEAKKLVIDTEKGTEKLVAYTAKEIEFLALAEQEGIAKREAMQAEKLAKEATRQSALEKLAALGLTEAEIQALAG